MAGTVLSSIAEMFGLFALGWLAQKMAIFDRADVGKIARLVFDVLFPCLIVHSIVTGLDLSRTGELWYLPLLGFGMMAVGFALGFALRRCLQNKDVEIARVFHHMCAINNYGFLPIFIIQNSMTAEALALFFVFNLGSTVGYWTIGVLSLGDTSDIRSGMKKLVSPPLISLLIALALAVANASDWMPGFLLRTTEKAGGIAVPLILISIGASFGESFQRSHLRDLCFLTVVRLVLLPAIALGILWALPLAPDIYRICAIVAVMPASATTVIMTKVYGGSSEFAASATLLTTLVSAVTIPLALWLVL